MLKNIVVALTANTTGLRTGMAQASGQVAALDGQMKATTATGVGLRKALAGLGIVAVVSLAAGLGAAVKASANFESSMNRVGALTSATDSEFDRLSDTARHLGSTTSFSASEAADGMGFLAQAGFEVNEIISAMPSTLDMAVVGQLDLARAADIASNVLQGFGLEASEMGRVNDVLALTSASANTSVEQLGDALSYAAPIASAAGKEIEEVSATIGMLSDAGLQGSRAGTTLVGIIAALEDTSGPASKALKNMGIVTHDSSGQLLSMVDIIRQFEERGLTAGEALDVFGRRAGPGMAVLVSTGADALADLETRLDGAAGAAERIAQRQFQGLEAAMITLRSATEGALIAVGGFLLPGLTSAVESVARGVQTFAQVAAGATEEAGRLAPLLGNVGDIAGGLASIVGRLVGAVMPLAAALASVAATGIVATLTALTSALAAAVGFVANNEVAFAALAGVLTTLLLPALISVVNTMALWAGFGLVRLIDGISAAAARASVAMGQFTAAAGILGLFAAAAMFATTSMKNARDEAEHLAGRLRDAFGQGIDTTTISGQVEALRAQLDGLGGRADRLQGEISDRTFGDHMRAAFSWTDDAQLNLNATEDELDALASALREMEGTATDAMNRINAAMDLDLDLEDIFAMADALGIDLANGGGDAADALVEAARAARAGEPDYVSLADEVDALASAQKAAADAVRDHASAMKEATDPIFAATQASERYADALADLRELESDGASERELAEARRDVGRASVDLAGALGELRDETGQLITTEPELRAYFRSMGVPRDVIDQLVSDFDMVRGELDEFEGRNPEIVLDADSDPARGELDFVDSLAGEWDGSRWEAKLEAEDASSAVVNDLTGLVRDSWSNLTYTTEVAADTTPALGAFDGVITVADGWRNRTDTSTIAADPGPGLSSFAQALTVGAAWDRRTDTSTIAANSAPGLSSFSQAVSVGAAWGRRTDTSTVRADTSQASSAIGTLATSLGSLVSRAWNIKVNANTSMDSGFRHLSRQEDGGVVSYYADGGLEHHVAQIAPAGAWRVWAEPETGGEAYIPMAPSKRPRSEAILGEVARNFGYHVIPMASGGVHGGGRRGDTGAATRATRDAPVEVHVQAWSDRFSLRQVWDELATSGVR